jgi:hypothetical protein
MERGDEDMSQGTPLPTSFFKRIYIILFFEVVDDIDSQKEGGDGRQKRCGEQQLVKIGKRKRSTQQSHI